MPQNRGTTPKVPRGWTDDDSQLATEFYWGTPQSQGNVLAEKVYGLDSPEAVICTTNDSGDNLYMFKSADKFYVWNMIENDVWEITKPTQEKDIMKAMNKKGMNGLELKELAIIKS